MSTSERFYIFIFSQTAAAIGAEAVLKDAGLGARAIPLPASVSSGCGISLRVSESEKDAAKILLSGNSFAHRLFFAEKTGLETTLTEIFGQPQKGQN